MSKAEFKFSGKAAWLGRKPNKWGKYAFNFYPRTAADRKAVKDTGIKNKVQEDDGSKSGVEGLFYVFRSDILFPIISPDGAPVSDMIGNGSDITVTLEVEQFNSPEHGPQARSRVQSVTIDNLVRYEKKETQAELPA